MGKKYEKLLQDVIDRLRELEERLTALEEQVGKLHDEVVVIEKHLFSGE